MSALCHSYFWVWKLGRSGWEFLFALNENHMFIFFMFMFMENIMYFPGWTDHLMRIEWAWAFLITGCLWGRALRQASWAHWTSVSSYIKCTYKYTYSIPLLGGLNEVMRVIRHLSILLQIFFLPHPLPVPAVQLWSVLCRCSSWKAINFI